MIIGDKLTLANSIFFGQEFLEIGQGKVSEKSGILLSIVCGNPDFDNIID